uniref:NADH-ubiquinone oxidoreductase chain 5 n=1 Tax=Haematomyzus elephantis TaxID=160133 RepID=A0A0R5QQD0_9NEOP|nr:NADH dehydrogenase subunit 5 [Haematomyzus elephantis]
MKVSLLSNKLYTHILMLISLVLTFSLLNLSWVIGGSLEFHRSLWWVQAMDVSVLIKVDYLSLGFLFMVSVVSFTVLIYSNLYMAGSPDFNKFILILVSFIASMMTLAFSGSLFWAFIGWDGLGLSSFCLVMFYQNWKSFNSALTTFIMNRVGDAFLLLSLWSILSMGSNISMFSASAPFEYVVAGVSGLICACSKSAQVPFSAWLPLAMAAPTPVSSLVHSSTLVTAGIYMIIRFKSDFLYSNYQIFVLSLLSGMTILLAGVSSLVEFDLKKVIALSTLLHIGVMINSVALQMFDLALFHMMAHAMFKSLLFMISGALIHLSRGSQDLRSLSCSSSPSIWMGLMIALSSMVGFPFMSGYYSKDLIILSSFSVGSFMKLWSMMTLSSAILFSSAYSFRLLLFLSLNRSKSSPLPMFTLKKEVSSIEMVKFSLYFGIILSVSLGSVLELHQDLTKWATLPSLVEVALKLFVWLALFLGLMIGYWVWKSYVLGKWNLATMGMWGMHWTSVRTMSQLFVSFSSLVKTSEKAGLLDFYLSTLSQPKLISLISLTFGDKKLFPPISISLISFLSLWWMMTSC